MRLIDADVANRWMEQNKAYIDTEILRAIPTVDAVPVVRCKDCVEGVVSDDNKYIICYKFCEYVKFDDFCSYGKRKDEANES